jgi:hypothetical protein
MLRHGGNRARLVKQNRAGTGRSLVQCKDVCHSVGPPSATSQTREAANEQDNLFGIEIVSFKASGGLPLKIPNG